MSTLLYQIRIVWRSLLSDYNHFLLNLLGFVLGISSFTTIMIYINHEFSYDKFHKNHNNIFRITTHGQRGQEDTRWAITNGGLVPILKEKVPEVNDAVKLFTIHGRQSFEIDQEIYSIDERSGFYVDSNYFEVFDFNLISGDKKRVLNQPNQIVLTEKLAMKLFHHLDVLGKTIILKGQNEQNDQLLKITGVLNNLPENSHIQFDYLIPGSGKYWNDLEDPKAGGAQVYVYFVVHDDIDINQLSSNIEKATEGVYGKSYHFPIQKITDIYFHANNLFEHAKTGNLNFSRILIIVAMLILIISIINYVLMSTTKAIQRSKEVGIKKILGVSRLNLIWQFLSEAILSSLFAGIISIFVIELVLRFVILDWFNLSFSLFDNLNYFLFILLLSILTGFFAGIFPAFGVSQLNIIDIFKGNFIGNSPSKFSLRDILVAIQFVFTITIIIGSIVVLRQLHFLKNKDLGFNKEYVINVSIPSNADNSTWNYFKESIRKESSIKSVGTSLYSIIGDDYNSGSVTFDTDTVPLKVQWNAINYDLIPAMNMQIVEGRNFSRDIPSDSFSIIINEAAKNEIGIENIIDLSVFFWWFGDHPGRVIGVVKDYHYQTFDQKILPTVLMLNQVVPISQNMLIRMNGHDYKETLSLLDQKWHESGIEAPFIYSFIDDWVADLVRKEERLSKMVTVLSVLTILISLLGLLGLISYTLDKKKNEISIRIVFGASIRNLIVLLNRRFLILIIIALVLSIPIAIWGTNSWLQQFAYRITLNPYDFILSILIIVLFPGGLISVKCWHAAQTNPTINLRDE